MWLGLPSTNLPMPAVIDICEEGSGTAFQMCRRSCRLHSEQAVLHRYQLDACLNRGSHYTFPHDAPLGVHNQESCQSPAYWRSQLAGDTTRNLDIEAQRTEQDFGSINRSPEGSVNQVMRTSENSECGERSSGASLQLSSDKCGVSEQKVSRKRHVNAVGFES